MSFKLAINPFFWAPVALSLVGDMGERIEGSFKVKFKRLSQGEYEALLAKIRLPVKPNDPIELEAEIEMAKAEKREPAWRITDREVVDQVLLDWDDLVDDADQKMPYTPDNLERVETILGVRAAIVNAFFEAHAKAPEKNSVTRRGASTN
jgi:hypothetical protein